MRVGEGTMCIGYPSVPVGGFDIKGGRTTSCYVAYNFKNKQTRQKMHQRHTRDQSEGIAKKINPKFWHRAAGEAAQNVLFARLPPHASFETKIKPTPV